MKDLGYIEPWNDAIADKHFANTERMLLGSAGKATVETAAQRRRRACDGDHQLPPHAVAAPVVTASRLYFVTRR